VLFVAKGYEILSTVECLWLRCLVMKQNGKIHFPTHKQLVKDHIPFMLAKTMDRYVLPTLPQCYTATMTFGLWMLRMSFDTLTLVVNFLNWEWVPCHVTIGLFKAPNIGGATLTNIVDIQMLKWYNLL